MKYKTSKLRKLESNRYSILTKDLQHCFICGYPKVDMHEIYGGANRQVSMQNGFCVPLCRKHHSWVTNDNELSLQFKRLCQKEYEKTNNREDFIALIGKNYL